MTEAVGNTDWEQITNYEHSRGVDAEALANRQALIDAYEAVSAGDYAPYWALIDPSVVFHEAPYLPYGGSHHGIEAVERAFAAVAATFSANRVEHHEVLTAGEYCISYFTCTFRIASNGVTGTLPVTEIFRFKNGKIVDWRVNYFDAAMMVEALTS